MELKFTCNQVVQLANGKCGVVAGFNGKPFLLVFDSYTSKLSRYDGNGDLNTKNEKYGIVKVFDGSSVSNVSDVFKKRFSTDGLPVVWERNS